MRAVAVCGLLAPLLGPGLVELLFGAWSPPLLRLANVCLHTVTFVPLQCEVLSESFVNISHPRCIAFNIKCLRAAAQASGYEHANVAAERSLLRAICNKRSQQLSLYGLGQRG